MLGDNRGTALHSHILALERLQEAKDEAGADFNERKKLVKEDGFDTNVVAAIMKRRKNGEGQTKAFDDLLQEYEFAIAEQKHLPLERRIQAEIRELREKYEEREKLADDVDFVAKAKVEPEAEKEPAEELDDPVVDNKKPGKLDLSAPEDELYPHCLALVVEHRKASISWLQRQLGSGYSFALKMIERMEKEGHVSPSDGAGKREVLIPPPVASSEHGPN